MGDDFWCRHLVATRGALDLMEGVARDRPRMAVRGIAIEAIFVVCCQLVRGKTQTDVVVVSECLKL
jgi:hypothetical protein